MTPTDQPGVASPCIRDCAIQDSTGLCQGCWRSLEEIMVWSGASDEQKRQVLENIILRKAAAGNHPPLP